MARHTDYLVEFDSQQQVTRTDDDWSVHAALGRGHFIFITNNANNRLSKIKELRMATT